MATSHSESSKFKVHSSKVAAFALVALICIGGGDATVAQNEITHISPRDNFVGPLPTRFEWSAVKGADYYLIDLVDEIDREFWQQDGIRETFVATPKELALDPGTYFWSVYAFRDGKQIAYSGRSAFVVLEN